VINSRAAAVDCFIHKCQNKGIRPSRRRVQAIYDHDYQVEGSSFDTATYNTAVAITRELVPPLYVDKAYRLVKLKMEWDWGYVNGRK
jgi:hypothetical protein